MKSTLWKTGVILFSVMLYSSCLKEADCNINNITTELQDEISFAAMEEGIQTKADVTSLSSFYVNCITGTMGSSEISKFSTVFTKSGSYYYGSKYWPSYDMGYGFYAANISITGASSGAYVSAENSTDVVIAYQGYRSAYYKSTIPLTFRHIFAKLGYCKVTAPSGYSVSGLSVKVTPYVSGKYKMHAGSWSNKSTGSTITLTTSLNSTTTNGTYVVPGTYSLALKYTLTKDSYSETFSKNVSVTLSAGYTNHIVLSLPAGNASGAPDGGIIVDPWEGGGDVGESM